MTSVEYKSLYSALLFAFLYYLHPLFLCSPALHPAYFIRLWIVLKEFRFPGVLLPSTRRLVKMSTTSSRRDTSLEFPGFIKSTVMNNIQYQVVELEHVTHDLACWPLPMLKCLPLKQTKTIKSSTLSYKRSMIKHRRPSCYDPLVVSLSDLFNIIYTKILDINLYHLSFQQWLLPIRKISKRKPVTLFSPHQSIYY